MARVDSRIPSLEIVEASLEEEQKKHTFFKFLVITIGVLTAVAAMAALTAILFLQIFQIDGMSMEETFREGDLVVAHNTFGAKREDIIAFHHEGDILVKRIIAVGGDTVDISEDGTVTVNSEPIEEPYLAQKSLGNCDIELPYRVPEGKFFVMGDHRAVSIDSRSRAIGCVDENDIIGKVFLQIWPIGKFGPVR